MCVKISLVTFTDRFPVFWLLFCILIADCFVIVSVSPFWGCSHFAYVRSFWRCSHFEGVLILSVFSFWMCSHFDGVLILSVFSFECALILTVSKTPRAPYSISFPTVRREKQEAQVSSQRVCRCARRHTKAFDQRDKAVTISQCKRLRNNPLFDTSTGTTLTAFVADNANCEYGHVRAILLEDVTRCISALCSQTGTTIFQLAPQVPTGEGSHVGRPKFVIPPEQLEYLLSYDISATDISKALGVSRSTIYRCLREYGISVSSAGTGYRFSVSLIGHH